MPTTDYSLSQTTNAPAPRRVHLAFIDALRGVACLAVLLYHNASGQQTDEVLRNAHFGVKTSVFALLGFGWLGVPLFLVLSGFCLFYPVIRRDEQEKVKVRVGDFFSRRLRRILPPYYAAIAFALAVSWLLHRSFHLAGWYDLPMHLLMLHNLRLDTLPTINGVFWTLALGWQMYLLFPFFVWWVRRRGTVSLAIAAGVSSVIWGAYFRASLGVHLPWWQSAATFEAVPGFAYIFIAGMYAAVLVARPSRSYVVPALTMAVSVAIPALWYAAFVSMVGPFVAVAWGTVFAALVVACSSLPAQLFRGRGVLPSLVSVGVFSYSLYLIHIPLLLLMDGLTLHIRLHGVLGHFWYWGRLTLVIAVSYAFFLAFERPFLTSRKNVTPAELARDVALSPAP